MADYLSNDLFKSERLLEFVNEQKIFRSEHNGEAIKFISRKKLDDYLRIKNIQIVGDNVSFKVIHKKKIYISGKKDHTEITVKDYSTMWQIYLKCVLKGKYKNILRKYRKALINETRISYNAQIEQNSNNKKSLESAKKLDIETINDSIDLVLWSKLDEAKRMKPVIEIKNQ